MENILDQIQTDFKAGNREETINRKNAVFGSKVRAAENNRIALKNTQKMLDFIETNTAVEQQVYSSETAELLGQRLEPVTQELDKRSEFFIQQQQELSQQINQIESLTEQIESDDVGFFEKRKLKKQREELDQEAFRTNQLVQATGQQLNQLRGQAEAFTKRFVATRDLQFEAEKSEENIRRGLELQNKIDRIQQDQNFNNAVVQTTAQIQVLSAGEVKGKDLQNSTAIETLWKVSGNDLENLGPSGRQTMALRWKQELTESQQRSLIPTIAMAEKFKSEGEQVTKQELIGFTMRTGTVEALNAINKIADVPGLQEKLDSAINPLVQARTDEAIETAEEQIGGGKLTPKQAQEIQQQQFRLVEQMPAQNLLESIANTTNIEQGQKLSGLGASFLQDENPAAILDDSVSPKTREVFNSQAFKDAIDNAAQNQDASNGSELGSAIEGMVNAFTQQGAFGNDRQKLEAVSAIADFVGGSAMSFSRNKGFEEIDTKNLLRDFSFNPGPAKIEIPIPERVKFAANKQGVNIPAQPLSATNPADILTYLEIVRAARSRKAERTKKRNDLLTQFAR